MYTSTHTLDALSRIRPKSPCFSSGPCKKHPGWNISAIQDDHMGRSHRAKRPKARIKEAINRSAQLLQLPHDWKLAIVPASDTGAFEMALWSMLGARAVDVFCWESFSKDWAYDIEQQLKIDNIRVHAADYGYLPDLHLADKNNDIVFVYNGTTSGVRVPDLDWISDDHEGIVFCDATSAVFALDIDFTKLDVVTWSWQKSLGGEAGFGMLALSPKAVERLTSYQPARPIPKIFRLWENGVVNDAIFSGSTINTPSMIAIEDLHSALDWAENSGGLAFLQGRCQKNYTTLNEWLKKRNWIDWLARDCAHASPTSMCLQIVDDTFCRLAASQQKDVISTMCAWLEHEQIAFDIAAYRDAPPGFRIWGGPTIEAEDIAALTQWLDWAFSRWQHNN